MLTITDVDEAPMFTLTSLTVRLASAPASKYNFHPNKETKTSGFLLYQIWLKLENLNVGYL